MKKFFSVILDFNHQLNNIAKQDTFTSIGILSLSTASLITTYIGMSYYTDIWIISMLASSGIQLLMLYAAVRFSTLNDRSDTKAIFLLILFFSSMSVSSFFSFAAFHEVMEPPKRRLEEADTLMRNEWTNVYSIMRSQSLGEFGQRMKEDNGGESGRFPYWVKKVSELRADIESYHSITASAVTADKASLMREPRYNEMVIVKNRQDDAAKRRDSLKQQITSMEIQIAELEQKAREAKSKYDTELANGGTALPGGRVTKPGSGPVSDKLKTDWAAAQAVLQEKKQEFENYGKQVTAAETDIISEGSRLNAMSDVKQLVARQSALDTAQKQLDTLNGMPIPPVSVTAAATGDGLMALQHEIEKTTSACLQIQSQFNATAASIRPLDLKYAAGSQSISDLERKIRSNTCSTSPIYSTGASIPQHIARIQGFIENCGPEGIPSVQSNALPAANAAARPPLGDDNAVQLERYATNFRALQGFFNRCLADAPTLENTDALKGVRESFSQLLLYYNPQAHQFTRALSAFKRGDPTAWFAALVAVLIDFLIFLTGLAMHHSSPRGNDGLFSSLAHEQKAKEITAFIEDHPVPPAKICDAISQARKETIEVDGILRRVFVIALDSDEFITMRPELDQMNNFGMIKIIDNNITVSDDQSRFIHEIIGRKYEGR